MNDDDRYHTILGSCTAGPWLIGDRPKGSDFQHLKDELIWLRLLIRQNGPEVVTF